MKKDITRPETSAINTEPKGHSEARCEHAVQEHVANQHASYPPQSEAISPLQPPLEGPLLRNADAAPCDRPAEQADMTVGTIAVDGGDATSR